MPYDSMRGFGMQDACPHNPFSDYAHLQGCFAGNGLHKAVCAVAFFLRSSTIMGCCQLQPMVFHYLGNSAGRINVFPLSLFP